MSVAAQSAPSVRSGGNAAIERFAKAIGYPDRIPDSGALTTLRVDGMEIRAEELSGRVVLSYVLASDAANLPTLAGYAAGRMLREDAALAWDGGAAILWQDAAADSDAYAFTRLFETFMNSCDWWRARIDALRGEQPPAPEAMVIMP